MRARYRGKLHAAAITLLLLSPGCSLFGPRSRLDLAPNARGVWPLFKEPLSPRLMLTLVEANDRRIRTLKCKASVVVKGEGSFSGIVRRRRHQQQLYVLGSKAGVTLFHMWTEGRRLTLYAPRDNVIYAGDMDVEFAARGGDSIAATARMLRDSFLSAIHIPRDCEVIEHDALASTDRALIDVRRGGAMWQSFVLHRATLLVASRTIFDGKGRPVLTVRYRDYRRFGRAWLPLVSEVVMPETGLRAKIELRKVEVNGKISPRVFEPLKRVPKSTPIRPLGELTWREPAR